MSLLTETKPTLPAAWYFDEGQYAKELQAIWYRDWVCVGRHEEIARRGDYKVVGIGSQQIIVATGDDGQVVAYHNTCRHRGAALCTKSRGHFANGRIICPYHTWTYSLNGRLVATPTRLETDDFDTRNYSLYAVKIDCWGGFLFVNLSPEPEKSLAEFLGNEAEQLSNWPLADMQSVRQEQIKLNCNWKIFWENYCECYHCPRVHPELCKIVPVYRKGLLNDGDDPEWSAELCAGDGRPRIESGLSTWSLDGSSALPWIEGLSAEERKTGMTFASFTASMYIVGHTDYVRSVRMLPTGPESAELVVDWLLMPGVKESHADEIEKMLVLGRLVVEQDGKICEINQRGLHSLQHQQGVLVPQEYSVWEFHEWLRERLSGLKEQRE